MTMTTQQTGGPTPTLIPLGAKLQSARESLRLERKDAAAQLRLNESIIDMIENNSFPTTMPPIFVRGYIRAYGKLLQLPEDVIHAGLEPIKPQTVKSEIPLPTPVSQIEPARQNKRLIRGFSAIIVFGLLWLSVSWWHTRAPAHSDLIMAAIPTETQTASPAPVTQSIPAGITVQADLAPQAVLPFVATPVVDAATTTTMTPNKAPAPVPAYKRAMADAGKTMTARNLDSEE